MPVGKDDCQLLAAGELTYSTMAKVRDVTPWACNIRQFSLYTAAGRLKLKQPHQPVCTPFRSENLFISIEMDVYVDFRLLESS